MKKVIGYIRVSTDEQYASGLGLESQKEKVEQYTTLYDLDLVEIISDASSGKNLNRDGLQKALKMLKQGQIEGIVIAKLDRLTRSVKDMGYLLEQYFASRHALFAVAEQIDTSSAAGRLMINVLISVAQWEREAISERTSDALQAKRMRGEKTGGKEAPFGYDSIDGKLIENADEQRIIGIMKSLRDEGTSFQKIADQLNNDGYRTRTGRAFRWHIVRKIIMRKTEYVASKAA